MVFTIWSCLCFLFIFIIYFYLIWLNHPVASCIYYFTIQSYSWWFATQSHQGYFLGIFSKEQKLVLLPYHCTTMVTMMMINDPFIDELMTQIYNVHSNVISFQMNDGLYCSQLSADILTWM